MLFFEIIGFEIVIYIDDEGKLYEERFLKNSPPAPNSVFNIYTRVMKFLKLPLLKFTNNNDDVETSEGIYHFGLFFASCRFEHFVSTDNMFIHILPYF